MPTNEPVNFADHRRSQDFAELIEITTSHGDTLPLGPGDVRLLKRLLTTQGSQRPIPEDGPVWIHDLVDAEIIEEHEGNFRITALAMRAVLMALTE
jgi:hypothetical protein